MSEFFEELKTLLSDALKDALDKDDFLPTLAKVCVANGLKCRQFKKLCRDVVLCRDVEEVPDNDFLEELFEQTEEQNPKKKLHNLHSIASYIKDHKKEAKPTKTTKTDEIEYDRNIIHTEPKYLELRNHFENKLGWCKIDNPAMYGKAFVTDEAINFEKEENVKTYFENKNFCVKGDDGKPKWHNFFDIWRKDPDIKTYERIVFQPAGGESNSLNLCGNYCYISKSTDLKTVALDRVFEHIRSICGYDNACYEYLLNYIAHIVQKPEDNCDVSVVMYGKEGCGKNILTQLIGDVIGPQYYGESAEPKDLFGQFATGMYKRMVFVYDEGDKKDTTGFMNRLKALVTGQKLRVELKGKDMFEVNNYCRLFFPTNNKQPFPVTKDNRRWFYLKASDKYVAMPDKERFAYFDALVKHFKDRNVIYSFCKYLMNRDLSEFNPNIYPKSEGLQQAMTVPLLLRCIHAKILTDDDNATKVYGATELLNIVIQYCKENNYNSAIYNTGTICNELQEYIDAHCVTKKRVSKGQTYRFDVLRFRDYIKKHNFNLDDDEDGKATSSENILQQIEQYRQMIQSLRNKFVMQVGHTFKNPLDEGVDKTDQQIKVDKWKTRILPVTKKTEAKISIIEELDQSIFLMSLD